MNICNFGDILRKLRQTKNLTQKELGFYVGLSKAVISKYENGLGFPSFDTLIHIAKYFGVSTDYLLGVNKSKSIDVSGLTDAQTDTIYRIVLEFTKSNK